MQSEKTMMEGGNNLKLLDYFKDLFSNKNPIDDKLTENSYYNTVEVEEVVSFLKKEFKRRQEDRRPFELQWILNMNFLNNNQYCDINLTAGEVSQISRDFEWEEREIYNHIAPIYETRLAKLCKIAPSPHVIPANSSTKSQAAAKMSKCILEGVDKDQDMQKKRATATAWSELCGCVFYGDRWESGEGRPLFYDENGNIIHEGNLEKDVITAFEIFPDSSFSQGITGCESIIRAKAIKVNSIYDRWGVRVKGREVDVFTLDQTNVGVGGFNRNSVVSQFKSTKIEKAEIVIEYMELPNRRHPKGLHIIMAGDKLLHYGEFIYRVGNDGKYGFPLVMQVCVETPGRFWPVSIIERLIPIQRSFNALKNRKKDILNRKAIGNWAVEDDGNVDVDDLEEEGFYPGKIHFYSRGGKPPQEIQNRSSITDFDVEEQRLLDEFTTISGVSPFASQSLPPTGSNSGATLEKIKESDDTRIGLTAENINIAAIASYKIDLRMYRQFAKTPRLLRHVGKNDEVQIIEWQASDLTSDDIIIEKEDELSQTPAQRRQMVLDLLQYKLFSNDTDPKIRNKVINQLQMGDWENVDDIEDAHVSRALRENMFIKQGKPIQVKEYDMHDLHIQEHNRWRLDVDFEEFESTHPELAQAFNQHVAEHEALAQQKVQQLIAIQQGQQLQQAQ